MIILNIVDNSCLQGITLEHCDLQSVHMDVFHGLVSWSYLKLSNGYLIEALSLQIYTENIVGVGSETQSDHTY